VKGRAYLLKRRLPHPEPARRMTRYVHIAKLSIALVAFANGTAALAASRLAAPANAGGPAVMEAGGGSLLKARVQRLPRVPRREPFEAAPTAEAASGVDG
jgi:hypothetical protein